jgi:hypothetical protein
MNQNKLDQFKKLWNDHYNWSTGLLTKAVTQSPEATYYSSDLNSEYFNLCVPKATTPADIKLDTIKTHFMKEDRKPSLVLFEDQQNIGFEEYLLKNGMRYEGSDTWVMYNPANKIDRADVAIVEVTPETFADYNKVLSVVFADFNGNKKYLEICENSISGKQKSTTTPDVVSKLFAIYDNGEPAAGGALFYSKSADIAYLHDGGTLEKFRGKGYQSALIKHRTQIALQQNITRIYSAVEPGGKSWSNCIKCGFDQLHTSLIFVQNDL